MHDKHLVDGHRLAVFNGLPCHQPLVAHDRGGQYEILDGHLRYEVLQHLGVTSILCLVVKEAHEP